MNSPAKLWIGMGLSVLLVALFLLTVDLERMIGALAEAEYWYVAPAVGLYLVSVLFRTLRWQRLLRHMRPISVTRLYPVVVVGYMANNLLPMRLGELVRSYYVGERENISKTSALVTIFIERLLDALTLLLFVALIAVFVPLTGLAEAFGERSSVPWPLLVAAMSLPFVLAFGWLLAMALAPSRAAAVASHLLRPLPTGLGERLGQMFKLILQGVKPLGKPTTLGGLFLASAPIWAFEAGLFYMIGLAFDLHHVYGSPAEMAVAMVLVTAIANIGSSVPAAPGGIGLFELVARETLVLLPLAAVDRAVADAVDGLRHGHAVAGLAQQPALVVGEAHGLTGDAQGHHPTTPHLPGLLHQTGYRSLVHLLAPIEGSSQHPVHAGVFVFHCCSW